SRAILEGFYDAGGFVVAVGDYPGYAGTANIALNQLALDIGSSMQFANNQLDCGCNVTSNINPDPLTAGVTSLGYGCVTSITGGSPLVSGSGTFIAVDGGFLMIGDINVFTGCGA